MDKTRPLSIGRTEEPTREATIEILARTQGCARGLAPPRDYDRAVSLEPLVELRHHQFPLKAKYSFTLQDTFQRMIGILETIARGVPQGPTRGEVPAPQVPKQQYDLYEYISLGQTSYMPTHVPVDTPVQMVPPNQVTHKLILAKDY